MSSLSQASGNAEVIRRIASLRADTQRQWGKMSVAQMLVHCQKPFQMAAGELQLKRSLIGRLFGGMAKKKFIDNPAPFKPNGPTDPRFRIKGDFDFERERDALVDYVRRFGENGPLTREPHTIFGPLTAEDWDRLLWKHMDHYLRQFGA